MIYHSNQPDDLFFGFHLLGLVVNPRYCFAFEISGIFIILKLYSSHNK